MSNESNGNGTPLHATVYDVFLFLFLITVEK